jgi:hypothetical protein
MRKLIIVVLFIFCVALAPPARSQGTYTAASCNQSAVNAAITAEQAHPVDGDIISIPAGTCTWAATASLSASFTNSVTIQGAGAKSATSGGASTTGSDLTVIIDNASYSGFSSLMAFGIAAGKSFRFTGIAILPNGSTLAAANGTLNISGSSTSVRVDHCHIGALSVGIYFGGSVVGVADHDLFDASAPFLNNSFAFHNGQGWNGDAQGNGDKSWTDTEHWGTSQFMYVEDTQFHNVAVDDAHDGARYVVRHSTMKSDNNTGFAPQMYNHGLAGNERGRSMRAVEVYLNNFSVPGTVGVNQPTLSLNGGTALFWGNTVTQYREVVTLNYTRGCDRAQGCPYDYLPRPMGWGYCGTKLGPSNWDGNTNSTGYPCLDSVARGAGDLITGAFQGQAGLPPYVVNSTTGTVAWAHQALSPVYLWNNTFTPAGGYSSNALVVDSGVATDNTDYYQQFGPSAEPGSFNGTKGVGQGLLSARPSTCTAGPGGNTPGVGYWATDTSTLYVCNPTNTWIVYYTPYTYPHPLTQSSLGTALAPPTNLTVTVQ